MISGARRRRIGALTALAALVATAVLSGSHALPAGATDCQPGDDGACAVAAAKRPTKGTKRALRRAVKRSKFVPLVVQRGRFKLVSTSVSTVGPWARASISPPPSLEIDPALGLFKKSRHRWRLVSLGTSGVGCSGWSRAPRDVRLDLRLSCP
jgi:hypothetical protein